MFNKTKKYALSTLSLAALFAFGSANVAAEELYYDIFGNVHISLDSRDSVDNPEFNSNTSTFGIKGGQKLGDSDTEVIFKLEWQLEATEREQDRAVVDRDQWVGFKGNFGKVIFGTSTMNYKQTSSKVDPLWRTQLEGRSALMRTASRQLGAGAGNDRGRLTNSVNYTTPKTNGFEAVINTTFSGNDDESVGVGFRHSSKKHLVFVDYFQDGDTDGFGNSESAVKVGGYYKFSGWTLSGQVENSEDVDGADYWMFGAAYKVSDKGTIKFTTGAADGVARESSSFALLYDHNLGGMTNIYAGYGAYNDDRDSANDDDILTFGVRYRY